jgi:hypothetical protein
MNSIGLPFCDQTVAIKSVTVPLDLIIDRKNSISLGSDSVELPKTSVSLGQNSVSVDRFSGNADQSGAADPIASVSLAIDSVPIDPFESRALSHRGHARLFFDWLGAAGVAWRSPYNESRRADGGASSGRWRGSWIARESSSDHGSRTMRATRPNPTVENATPRSLLNYPAMARCLRFLSSPRRDEGAYPLRSVTEEQRRRTQKAKQPGGRELFGPSGGVVRSLRISSDLLVALALPSGLKSSRAPWLGSSTGS